MAKRNDNGVWGEYPISPMHTSGKHIRNKPEGRAHFSHRMTRAEKDTLAALDMPGRCLTREQMSKLQMLRRKAGKS